MKKHYQYEEMSVDEMLDFSEKKAKRRDKATDLATHVGVLLLFPYVIWLSKYSASYVASVQNRPIAFNFDGIMLMFHNLLMNGNMIVHESGHGICYLLPCSQFLTALNGTLFQLALPLIFIYYYHKRHNELALSLGFIWLAQNLVYVAWYMSYSQTPNLYPFFLGGSAIHDFWYIFTQLGVLEYDWLISGVVRFTAGVILIRCHFYLLYISFFKKNTKKRKYRFKS